MSIQIQGAGRFPYGLEVDSHGMALVRGVVKPTLSEESEHGDSYCIATGPLALTTTAAYNGILQVKNTSARKMYLSIFCLGIDMAYAWWKVIRNPDELGTVWTAGTVLSPNNVNFSSGNVFPAINGAFKGGDAKTISGGVMVNEFPTTQGEFTKVLEGAIILGPANSIGFSCKPSAAGNVHASMLVYFGDS